MGSELEILSYLEAVGVVYERHDHPAVFTCEQAEELGLDIKGADTKNLFLTDQTGSRYFLLVTTHDKRVDLKEFAKRHSLPKLSFGSPERLMEYLGVEPGSVTLLGLFNDRGRKVELFIDEDVWAHEFIQCHPLVNTATLVIARADVEKFFAALGHTLTVVPVPARA